jgi:GNAT superfamily N-acetyltransferase
MTYNPEYYLKLMDDFGMKKAKDLVAFHLKPSKELPERLVRLSQIVKKRRPQLKVRPVNLSNFNQEVKIIKEIYNSAWSKNWGFVPATDEEFDDLAKRLKSLVVPDLVQVAFFDDKPAGFIMTIPNYNEVLIKLGGKLTPFSIIKFLFLKNKIKSARLITLGICKEYRNMGIDAILYLETLKAAFKHGYTEGELSWILEDNDLTIRAAEMMGGRIYKKYRIYEKKIE